MRWLKDIAVIILGLFLSWILADLILNLGPKVDNRFQLLALVILPSVGSIAMLSFCHQLLHSHPNDKPR